MGENKRLTPLVVDPDAGRTYPMGRMTTIFKADLEETDSTMSASEWWLEPKTEGPEIHAHPQAHLFYVIEGILALFIEGKDWFEVNKGAYIYIPGDTSHGFENRSESKVGFLSINTPGGFEKSIPYIADYFKNNPLGDVKTST